jgi:hypothetical protein
VWVGSHRNGENFAGRYQTVAPDEVIEVHDDLFDNYATGPWEPVDVPRKRAEVREQPSDGEKEIK